MKSTKFIAALAFALPLLGSGIALADQGTQPAGQQDDSQACPTHMTMGPDGVCVKAKSGRMGFDLAAPSDNDNTTPSKPNAGGTRSIVKGHHAHS